MKENKENVKVLTSEDVLNLNTIGCTFCEHTLSSFSLSL